MTEPLTKDGFICSPDFAVSVAEMVSNLEAAYEHCRQNGSYISTKEIVELFEGYLRGDEDAESVNQTLHEEWPEAFPGLPRGSVQGD